MAAISSSLLRNGIQPIETYTLPYVAGEAEARAVEHGASSQCLLHVAVAREPEQVPDRDRARVRAGELVGQRTVREHVMDAVEQGGLFALHPLPVEARDALAPDDLERRPHGGVVQTQRRRAGGQREGGRAQAVRGVAHVGQHAAHAHLLVHLGTGRARALEEPGPDRGVAGRGQEHGHRRAGRRAAQPAQRRPQLVLVLARVDEGEVDEHRARPIRGERLQHLRVYAVGHGILHAELAEVFLAEQHHGRVALPLAAVGVLDDGVDERLGPGG
jgi:hypothetical protein